MSEEEKCTKKQKIEDNRRLRALSRSLSMPSKSSYSPLTVFDEEDFQFSFENCNEMYDEDLNGYRYLFKDNRYMLLKRIKECYDQAIRLNISVAKGYESPCLRNLNHYIAVVNEPALMNALRMITFFKLTTEFNVDF